MLLESYCVPSQAPLVGRWSDAYGRKPFLIICFLLASLPVLVLVLHMCYQLPLYFYFPAQAWTLAHSFACSCMLTSGLHAVLCETPAQLAQ